MMAVFQKLQGFKMSLFLTSNILSAPHGFFSRKGGYSKGVYSSLNCALGSDDNIDHALKNRSLALSEISKKSDLVGLYQIHSNIVHVIDYAGERPQGDAMVSNVEGIALSILTADCAPVLFHDAKNKIIGAAHAGWQGAYGGIIENTIHKMCDIGAEKENIHAAIGPCISQESYEVGAEFFDRIAQPIFFKPSDREDHHYFDLPAYIYERLRLCYIGKISSLKNDTYAKSDLFFSYRFNTHHKKNDYGRQISIIALP